MLRQSLQIEIAEGQAVKKVKADEDFARVNNNLIRILHLRMIMIWICMLKGLVNFCMLLTMSRQ
ncbi:alpha-L-rhamnosidase [Sesbania bispinosa]|nr:alpha-L-rhamnosidase [Sesbania bispinosa]